MSFGLLAAPLLGVLPAIVMSAMVWSGTAQFAAMSIVSSGGSTALAAGAAVLANARFLPMGFAVAPSMRGGRLRRLATGCLLADASFVIGHREEGRFDVTAIAWAAPLQYLAWNLGTVAGALGASAVGDPDRWGLDVLFPVFYLSLLLPELIPRTSGESKPSEATAPRPRADRPLVVAGLAAAVTLVLTPITPPGVPVVAAAVTALIGLQPRRSASRGRKNL